MTQIYHALSFYFRFTLRENDEAKNFEKIKHQWNGPN